MVCIVQKIGRDDSQLFNPVFLKSDTVLVSIVEHELTTDVFVNFDHLTCLLLFPDEVSKEDVVLIEVNYSSSVDYRCFSYGFDDLSCNIFE